MKIKDIADAYDVQYVLLPPDIMKTNKYVAIPQAEIDATKGTAFELKQNPGY